MYEIIFRAAKYISILSENYKIRSIRNITSKSISNIVNENVSSFT